MNKIFVEMMDVELSIDNAKELKEKLDLDITDFIWDEYKECTISNKFIIDDIEYTISFPFFFSIRDIHTNSFSVFIHIESANPSIMDVISKDTHLQQQILDHFKRWLDELSSRLTKYNIPIENLDNIIYDEKTAAFYVKLGETTPKTIPLSLKLYEDSISDYTWSCHISD